MLSTTLVIVTRGMLVTAVFDVVSCIRIVVLGPDDMDELGDELFCWIVLSVEVFSIDLEDCDVVVCEVAACVRSTKFVVVLSEMVAVEGGNVVS